MRLAVTIRLLCVFCAAPNAGAALVPAATGSRQHVTDAQPLDTSMQPITFGQTDFNSTGGPPGVATQAGLYQISGALTTTSDAPAFDGPARLPGAVVVNGEDRGDFGGILTPG